jgi:hypothetical protein
MALGKHFQTSLIIDYYNVIMAKNNNKQREQIFESHRPRQTQNNLACGHNASTDCRASPSVALAL